MNLCRTILKKDIYDLELSDIQDFFSIEQEETSILEFKSGKIELHDIYRQISAFLNTEGGLLILGSPPEKSMGNNKVCVGNLTPCIKISNQDTLLRSIASNIAPSPSGIKAKSFPHEGGMVYILEIPQSVNPPHQASNEGKYYIRFERDAKPAPHGIIEALFNRRQTPNLTGSIGFLEVGTNEIDVIFKISNESVISAERVGVMINIYGTKTIKSTKNFRPSMKDDKVTYHDLIENTLLVQGLSIEFSVRVIFRSTFGFATLSFYCKDTKFKMKQTLFKLNPWEAIKRYDSETTTDSSSDLQVIINEYQLLQEKKLRNILTANGHNKLSEPASLNDIYDLAHRLGVEWPESYVAFLSVSNGFAGYVNGKDLRLHNIQYLNNEQNNQIFNISSKITIGHLNEFPIFLSFLENDEPSVIFSWTVHQNREFIEKKSTSFYGFLDIN